jgi:hypothetical protein
MSAYSNRHNIKPVARNFKRGAPRATLDEMLYRINTTGLARATDSKIDTLAGTTSGQVRSASRQQVEEAFYTNVP